MEVSMLSDMCEIAIYQMYFKGFLHGIYIWCRNVRPKIGTVQ